MRQLVNLGASPERHFDLGQAIWKYDLLSMPGSHALVQLVRHILATTDDERVKSAFERIRPRTKPVIDTFATGNISEAWWMDGGTFETQFGRLLVKSDDAHTETTLRLLGSEHFRDSFVEATVERKAGSFWLYARRTADHMARFGTDGSGQLFLQVWRHGRLVNSKSRAWAEPKDNVRLRLEVRGEGLVGFVDGQPAFGSPLEIPPEFGLGWIGISIYSPTRGKAQAILSRTSAGPLASRIALLPSIGNEAELDAALATLRPEIFHISDISPRWFRVNADGSWVNTINTDEKLLRLFSRYYHLRVMPVVDVLSNDDINGRELIELSIKHKLDGFILQFENMPDKKWFEVIERNLEGAGLKILAVELQSDGEKGNVRGIADGSDLLMGVEGGLEILVHPWISKDGEHKPISDLPREKAALLVL